MINEMCGFEEWKTEFNTSRPIMVKLVIKRGGKMEEFDNLIGNRFYNDLDFWLFEKGFTELVYYIDDGKKINSVIEPE